MLIDITLKATPEMLTPPRPELMGHVGTHFDVMDREFPLSYTKRRGIVFDVRGIFEREIGLLDIDISKAQKDGFVIFYTGFTEVEGYGTKRYFSSHPELSHELIDALVEKGVSVIGVDFAGIRRGKEHIPKDKYCADRGVFVIENLINLSPLLKLDGFTVHTYPMNIVGVTGLPCRVIAET